MRLKDLHLLLGDHRAAHAADQFFRFAAEHHAGDDFDPSRSARLLEHGPSRYTTPGGRGSVDILRFFGGYPIVTQCSCGFSPRALRKGRIFKDFLVPSTPTTRLQ